MLWRDIVTDGDIINAEDFAADVLRGNSGGHDISHIRRVMNNARIILDGEKNSGADANLVLLCCALHDVDDRKIKACDAEEFSRLREFFANAGLSDRLFEQVMDIISHVSYTNNHTKNPALCIEAQIVQDADRLDALGAIGIARAFAYGGSVGRHMYGEGDGTTISHFYDKLFLLPGLMNTITAKRMADERTEFMKEFLTQFNTETKDTHI